MMWEAGDRWIQAGVCVLAVTLPLFPYRSQDFPQELLPTGEPVSARPFQQNQELYWGQQTQHLAV